MPKMTEKEILALVEQEFSAAMGAPDGDISKERALAWDYYLSKPFGNEVDGQSQVVTSDVADVVDGIMPSLLRMFTVADNLVFFDPVGPEDVEQSEQESDYVNYIFFKQNPAFMILYTWFFDALVQKNGIVMAYRDESEVTTSESYSKLTTPELISLLSDDELEPVEQSIETDPETGATLHSVLLQRTTKEARFVVENVPPEEYRISNDARHLDPSKARMVGREREISRAELIAMGFDAKIVNSLSPVGKENRSSEQNSRRDQSDDTNAASPDPSQDLILVRQAYIRIDREKNSKPELRQITTADHKILGDEAADRQPFHIISPQPLPHKHFGRASAEKVMDNQQVGSTLLRQTLDNLYRTNNPSHAVWEQGIGENTMDDLLTSRIGGINRFARPPSESYMPMTVPFVAGASFDMLAYLDKVKRDRTGVHSDSEGLAPEQLKHIQQSVLGQSLDLSRMKIEAVARIFAETGIKSLFLHLHELCLKHQNKKQMVRLRNKWVEIDPASWRTRYDMTVNIGLGIGTRDYNKLVLQEITNAQKAIVDSGGMNLLVTPKNIYNAATELVKNANLKDPALFFTDPGDKLAPPPSSEQEALQAQQQQMIQRQQQLDAQDQALKARELELKRNIEAAKLNEQKEAREDKLMIAVEQLRNDLTEMKLKYGSKAVSAAQ